MPNSIIGQNEQTVNLDNIIEILETKRCFWLEVNNGQTAVILQNGIEEEVWLQRFRQHGPRKYIAHHRVNATYSRVEITKEIGKEIVRRFFALLDRFSYETAERDEDGRVIYANILFQVAA